MLEQFIRGFLENFGFIMVVVAAAIAAVRAALGKPFSEELLRWSLLLPAGANGIFTAGTHIFMPAYCAEQIGWPDSPFQYEVGIADLTIGVLGIAAFWGNFGFRLAATVAAVMLYGGDAIGHIHQMIIAKNFKSGNAGSWFWMDVLLPLILVVSFAIYWRRTRSRAPLRKS
jgi:hypothetical protein